MMCIIYELQEEHVQRRASFEGNRYSNGNCGQVSDRLKMSSNICYFGPCTVALRVSLYIRYMALHVHICLISLGDSLRSEMGFDIASCCIAIVLMFV